MASCTLNDAAVANVRPMIDARQYVLDSTWGDVQPSTDDELAFLTKHDRDDDAGWHLDETSG